MDGHALLKKIQIWGRELGFSQIAVADLANVDLSEAEADSVKLDCFYCMKHSECSLKKCAGCNVARYCDRECQKADWSSHKNICRV